MVSEKVTYFNRFMWVFNTLFHQIYAIVTVFIFWTIFYNYKLNTQFSWHVILATIAYIPLMGEAIILFASDNVWSRSMERSTKSWIHGLLLLLSGILVTAGIAVMIDSKGSGAKHFKSIHGWTGLVSWIFVLLSQFLGLAAVFAQRFSKLLRPVYIKCLHNLLGILGYIFGIVSLCYGLDMRSFSRYASDEALTATFCLLGFTTAWSILAALKSGYNQLRILFT